jgi:hypothetical protein
MAGYSIIQMDEVPLTDRLGSLLNCGPPRRELDIALGPVWVLVFLFGSCGRLVIPKLCPGALFEIEVL